MLLKMAVLEGIREGKISLAFRRWKRPTVREGGELTTPIGVLAIDGLREVTMNSISDHDCKRAGYASKRVLLAELRQREGKVYRIELRLAGEDRRIALRNDTKPSAHDLEDLRRHLDKMDARSQDGAWTTRVLAVIRSSPKMRAIELADELRMDLTKFKQRVRKLKALGLTESLGTGYRLSPRGQIAWHSLT